MDLIRFRVEVKLPRFTMHPDETWDLPQSQYRSDGGIDLGHGVAPLGTFEIVKVDHHRANHNGKPCPGDPPPTDRTELDRAMAAIVGPLPRDTHLATGSLAVASGPDATLACAECGRAKWMHGTRHDTCALFRWITEDQLTDDKIMAVSHLPSGLTIQQRALCSVALNHFGAVPRGAVIRSRVAVARILNDACERLSKVRA